MQLGRLTNRIYPQYACQHFIYSTDLILAVMLLSEAVLFHREIMSSVGRMEMTTPHISLPTINCSPSIASNWLVDEGRGGRDGQLAIQWNI